MPTDWRQFYGIPDPMPDDYLDGDSIHRLDEILKGIILDPDAESRAERVAEWIALGNQIEAGLVLLGERSDSLRDLWTKAFGGDNRALFRLLRIFKWLAGAKWVYYRVRAACETGDDEFLREYGKALAEIPRIDGHTDRKRTHYLMTNWVRETDPLYKKKTIDILYELRSRGIVAGKGTPPRGELKRLDRYIERLLLRRRREMAT